MMAWWRRELGACDRMEIHIVVVLLFHVSIRFFFSVRRPCMGDCSGGGKGWWVYG